jgi:hypothetical protein
MQLSIFQLSSSFCQTSTYLHEISRGLWPWPLAHSFSAPASRTTPSPIALRLAGSKTIS